MEMVARMCPYISKMFFIFHEKCVQNFLVLEPFEYITELCLYGGSFYQDKMKELLQIRGYNITRLSLISVQHVDYLAIAYISNFCPNMISFGLSNCDLGDYRPMGDLNSDTEYERRQNYVLMAKKAHETVKIFENLEEITVQCDCKTVYLTYLLGRCPTIKSINLGNNLLLLFHF